MNSPAALKSAARQRPQRRRTLRVASFLAPHLYWFYAGVVRLLSERLALPLELIPGADYAELSDVDLAFVCSLPYVEHQEALEPLAAPVLVGERFGGRPIYYSDVIVSARSRFTSFLDLKGRSWAYNEPQSQSGYGITRDHLLRLGETRGFFGAVVEAGYHERALHMVAAGAIDGAAIDCHVLSTYLAAHPFLASQLRVIATLGPSPIQPLVASRRLPSALKQEVRRALVHLHDDPAAGLLLARAEVRRFVSVDSGAYKPIRAMRAAALQASFMQLR